MKIQLSDHFTTGKLLRFVAPSIVMMIFTSVYGVVDGLFVSNFVGKTAFAAVNLIFPLLMILGALGFMIGTGGSALVARTLGEGDSGRAQRYFSMLVYVTIGGGIVFSVLGLLYSGGYWGEDEAYHTLAAAFGNTTAAQALVWGSCGAQYGDRKSVV